MKTVAIVTHGGDEMVPDLVAAALRKRGARAVRIDVDAFPGRAQLTLTGDGRALYVDERGDELDLARLDAAWLRRLWTARAGIDVDARFADACAAQAREALEGWIEAQCRVEGSGATSTDAAAPGPHRAPAPLPSASAAHRRSRRSTHAAPSRAAGSHAATSTHAAPSTHAGPPTDAAASRAPPARGPAAPPSNPAPRLVVNALSAGRRAENKVVQLGAARAAGLDMPATVVTNDPVEARAFVREGPVVAKLLAPLSQTVDASGPFVYTSPVDDADVDDLEHIRAAPMILQRRIDKVREVRVVVAGGRVLAGTADAGALDWRNGLGSRWRKTELPDDVARGCVELVGGLGLAFGACDLVVDGAGRHFFLELNPAGEWGFLAKEAGLDVAGALASLLVGR